MLTLRTRPTRLTVLLAVAGLGGTLAGCGEGGDDGRNPVAYCKAFYTSGSPIRKGIQQINDAGVESNPLGAMVKLISAPHDLATIFDAMADHADDTIRSDTEAVRDSFQKLSDDMPKSVTNPLEGLVGNVGNALANSGSMQRVSDYMEEHCPAPNSDQAQQWIADAGGDH